MKFYQLLILTLLFISCEKKENDYLGIIKQNNHFLQEEIENYTAQLYLKSHEQPNLYDSLICKKIDTLQKEANSLKKYTDYESINLKIKEIVKEEKLNITLNSISSGDITILKNNLLLNLAALNKQYLSKKSNVIYDVTYTPYIKSTTKNDTLILNFFHHNSYLLTTDSIIDGNDKIINYKDNNKCRIWQVKYKPKSSKSTYYGKLFEVDSDGNTYLVKKIKHSTTK